ncbi:MAG: DUF4249 domain-containing protein [Bacteroidia bacterium]
MLKYCIRLTGIIILGLALASCEEVIDIDLNSEAPQIVIEASLEASKTVFEVQVSETADYFDAGVQDPIDNATVVLQDAAGTETLLSPVGDGRYRANIQPAVDQTYSLRVNIDGEVYEAKSYLPEAVTISALELEYQSGGGPIEPGFQLFINFQDDPAVTNYYRIKNSINGSLQNTGDDLRVTDDRLFNGGEAHLPLFQTVFDAGDTVEIALIHFDEQSFGYFDSLTDIVANAQGPNAGTAAPGNPNSNWTHGALGYFSASSSSKQVIIVE